MNSYDIDAVNNISIFNRSRAELTGIYDVVGFTDTAIVVTCKSGNISIDGAGLKIESFDGALGVLSVSGNINGLFYYGGVEKEKKNKLKRLFG